MFSSKPNHALADGLTTAIVEPLTSGRESHEMSMTKTVSLSTLPSCMEGTDSVPTKRPQGTSGNGSSVARSYVSQ